MSQFTELWQQPSFERIAEWINLNSTVLLNNAFNNRQHCCNKIIKDCKLEITYIEATWNNYISNYIGGPYSAQATRTVSGLKVFPGWNAKIEFSTSCYLPVFAKDIFEGTRLRLGTGSCSSAKHKIPQRYGYTTIFWADDWPALTARRNLINTKNIITGFPVEKTTRHGIGRYYASF